MDGHQRTHPRRSLKSPEQTKSGIRRRSAEPMGRMTGTCNAAPPANRPASSTWRQNETPEWISEPTGDPERLIDVSTDDECDPPALPAWLEAWMAQERAANREARGEPTPPSRSPRRYPLLRQGSVQQTQTVRDLLRATEAPATRLARSITAQPAVYRGPDEHPCDYGAEW